MEKKEVFKKNVLKRLYGDDTNLTPGNDSDATNIPENIIKQGLRLVPDNRQGDVPASAVKIYTVSLPPAGYNVEEHEVTRETTNDGDSHSGSEESGEERRVKKHRRRGKVYRSKKIESGGVSDMQINETDKQLATEDISGLTKNQKRKQKKKRRKEREKMQSVLKRKEFIYTEADQKDEEDNSMVKERAPVFNVEKCEDFLRFLFAVWDVYKAEYEAKKDFMKVQQEESLMLDIEAFLKECDNAKELENLCQIKSVLVLGDQSAVRQKLEIWRSSSNLQQDCQELMEGLSKYWLNVMMKR